MAATEPSEQPTKQIAVTAKTGRPSKYNPAILTKSIEYINTYADYGHKIPSIAGLAQLLDTTRERLHVWSNEEGKEEFRNILNSLAQAQEQALLSNGLDGTFNSTITKLVLSKHGYHDKEQGNQGVSINIQINRDGSGVTIDGEASGD